jgi:hypothetical protein
LLLLFLLGLIFADRRKRMRTEQEIKDKIKIYKLIQIQSSVFTSEFTLANGAITALEWVLNETKEGE